MTWKLRFCKASDLQTLLQLSQEVGESMTSMPQSVVGWREKIADTENTINGDLDTGCYFLVLENLKKSTVVGTTAVYTRVGEYRPYYAMRHEKNKLYIEPAYTGAIEIGSLYITPEARYPGLGAALAKSRYLMMGMFPHLFTKEIMACCRGWLNFQERSPVWDSVGGKHTGIEFNAAALAAAKDGNGWIADFLPDVIDVDDDVGVYLHRAHPHSEPAKHMLMREGFVMSDYVDILDGGPMFHCDPKQTATSKSMTGAKLVSEPAQNQTSMMLMGFGDINNLEIYIMEAELTNGIVKVRPNDVKLLGKHMNSVCSCVLLEKKR